MALNKNVALPSESGNIMEMTNAAFGRRVSELDEEGYLPPGRPLPATPETERAKYMALQKFNRMKQGNANYAKPGAGRVTSDPLVASKADGREGKHAYETIAKYCRTEEQTEKTTDTYCSGFLPTDESEKADSEVPERKGTVYVSVDEGSPASVRSNDSGYVIPSLDHVPDT